MDRPIKTKGVHQCLSIEGSLCTRKDQQKNQRTLKSLNVKFSVHLFFAFETAIITLDLIDQLRCFDLVFYRWNPAENKASAVFVVLQIVTKYIRSDISTCSKTLSSYSSEKSFDQNNKQDEREG